MKRSSYDTTAKRFSSTDLIRHAAARRIKSCSLWRPRTPDALVGMMATTCSLAPLSVSVKKHITAVSARFVYQTSSATLIQSDIGCVAKQEGIA